MNTERQLSRMLAEEAERTDVDVPTLYAETRDRIADGRPVRRSHRTMLVAAAVTVVALATGLGLVQGDGFELGLPQDPAAVTRGGVDDTFSCAATSTYDFTRPETVSDDDFLPRLDDGPAAEARELSAPRYEYTESGDRAVLRLGNRDGSLASISEFKRVDDGWKRATTTRCSSDVVTAPTSREWRLGEHGVTPYPAEKMQERRYVDGSSRLIDDRPFYDAAGLMRHRSMYVAPCGRRMCWVAGTPTSMLVTDLPVRERPVPSDIRSLFLPRDELVGKDSPYGLWELYAPAEVTGLRAELRDGSSVAARAFRAGSWDRTLFVLLAPYDDVVAVHVALDGREVGYRPEELPGHDPRYPS